MDKKDLQIMELLAQNCRLPHKTLAQALALSKDTISYRIKKLERDNYIKQYMMFVDARKLGFTRYHILIKFDTSAKNKQLFYDRIAKHKFVMWSNSFIGRYDLQIIVDAKDSFHLNAIREELFSLCDNQINEYFILTHLYDLEFTPLNPILDLRTKFQQKLDHSFSSILETRKFPVGLDFQEYSLSETDVKILQTLADNPQASLIQIANLLSVDRATVKKRIITLIENKVILNFGANPNLSKQGFVTYYLLVRLEQETPPDALKKPFQKLQNIFYAGKMLGSYDMLLYLNARNPKELHESIELFKSEIEGYLVSYDLLVQEEIHHWRQFTQGIYDDLLERTSK